MQFRPPLEELRSNYYREMKKFISIPSQFAGFGNPEVFVNMAERNSTSLAQVYRKAEILFARLSKLRDRCVCCGCRCMPLRELYYVLVLIVFLCCLFISVDVVALQCCLTHYLALCMARLFCTVFIMPLTSCSV